MVNRSMVRLGITLLLLISACALFAQDKGDGNGDAVGRLEGSTKSQGALLMDNPTGKGAVYADSLWLDSKFLRLGDDTLASLAQLRLLNEGLWIRQDADVLYYESTDDRFGLGENALLNNTTNSTDILAIGNGAAENITVSTVTGTGRNNTIIGTGAVGGKVGEPVGAEGLSAFGFWVGRHGKFKQADIYGSACAEYARIAFSSIRGWHAARYAIGDYITAGGIDAAAHQFGDYILAEGFSAGNFKTGSNSTSLGAFSDPFSNGNFNIAIGDGAGSTIGQGVSIGTVASIDLANDQITVTAHGLPIGSYYNIMSVADNYGPLSFNVIDANTLERYCPECDEFPLTDLSVNATVIVGFTYQNAKAIGKNAVYMGDNSLRLGGAENNVIGATGHIRFLKAQDPADVANSSIYLNSAGIVNVKQASGLSSVLGRSFYDAATHTLGGNVLANQFNITNLSSLNVRDAGNSYGVGITSLSIDFSRNSTNYINLAQAAGQLHFSLGTANSATTSHISLYNAYNGVPRTIMRHIGTGNYLTQDPTTGLISSVLEIPATGIEDLDASKITTGIMATARLGAGTASATTFLAGDGSWKTAPSGADNMGNHTAAQKLDMLLQVADFGSAGNVGIEIGGAYKTAWPTGNVKSYIATASGTLPNSVNGDLIIGARSGIGSIRFGNNGAELGRFHYANGYFGLGDVAPTERLSLSGNIKMVDGNEGAGKVLTSDANGVGTWQDASAWNHIATQNIELNDNYLSNDGDPEGVKISDDGDVTIEGGDFIVHTNAGTIEAIRVTDFGTIAPQVKTTGEVIGWAQQDDNTAAPPVAVTQIERENIRITGGIVGNTNTDIHIPVNPFFPAKFILSGISIANTGGAPLGVKIEVSFANNQYTASTISGGATATTYTGGGGQQYIKVTAPTNYSFAGGYLTVSTEGPLAPTVGALRWNDGTNL